MLDLNSTNANDIVSREGILSKVSDRDIFSYYIGDYSKSMKSPIRGDNIPSFSVYPHSTTGKLMFKDFVTGEFGDCFDLVRLIYGLNFYNSCVRINEDLNLGFNCPEASNINDKPILTVAKNNIELPQNKQLGVKLRRWYDCDRMYWTVKYDLKENQLKYYNIFPVQYVFLGSDIIWTHSEENPIYAYLFYKDNKYYYKIYRPLSPDRQFKWMSSTNRTVLQGWDQLPESGDTLILTKSLKDVAVYRTLGFYALACQNEVSMVKNTVMDELKRRFKRIVINQDHDPAGIQGTEALAKEYNLPYYYLTGSEKDISDYKEWHTKKDTITLIKTKLREIWPGLY